MSTSHEETESVHNTIFKTCCGILTGLALFFIMRAIINKLLRWWISRKKFIPKTSYMRNSMVDGTTYQAYPAPFPALAPPNPLENIKDALAGPEVVVVPSQAERPKSGSRV